MFLQCGIGTFTAHGVAYAPGNWTLSGTWVDRFGEHPIERAITLTPAQGQFGAGVYVYSASGILSEAPPHDPARLAPLTVSAARVTLALAGDVLDEATCAS